MKYSVIDISSSSLSLIVAAADEHKTELLFKERFPISFAHYLSGRKFTQRGMEKLIDCLKEMKETCKNFGVQRGYLISTAALRYIENFEEVRARVLAETGFPVNFIDAATEAYCDYIANIYYTAYERPVLIDLGGKSIEVCDLAKRRKEDMTCFDFGLLDLYRKFVANIFPSEKEAKAIRAFVKEKFEKASLPKEGVYATAVMVGAANAAIYDVYADFTGDKAESGVRVIRYKQFKKLVKHLLTGEDRSKLVLNSAPEKLYLIGSAAIVLKALFKRFGVDNILISDRGVKEGYLQLVLEGRETGRWYDFATAQTGGEERVLPAEAPAGQEKPAQKAAKKAEPAAQKPERKQQKKAPAAQKASPAEGGAPKRRGRPPKAPAAENAAPMSAEEAQKPQNEAPMPAPKRRGRPPKNPT